MKKTLIFVVASVTASIPAIVFASHLDNYNFGPFANRGQCERALNQQRNEARKVHRDEFTPSEINQQARTQAECQQNPDGTYNIVFI